MKIGISWLYKYCSFYKDKKYLILNHLTKIGFEVEKVIKENFKYCNGVIVGKILSISSIVCKKKNIKIFIVKIKDNKYIKIFFNDENFFCVGDRVAVALRDSIIYKKFFLINKNKNLFVSEGIFCSYKDLKLIGNFDRLIYFSKYFSIGTSVQEVFSQKFKTLSTLSINITNNRNDCLSLVGLSRELCALNNYPFKNFCFFSVIPKIVDSLKYCFKNKKFYKNYFSRTIRNINLNVKTPFWIIEKLRFCNIEPKNIIQDIINYVSIKFNQTFHVFNLNKVKKKIIVRISKKEEIFFFTNKDKIVLKKKFLVISDKEKILCLGNGLLTAKNVKINNDTKNIYIGTGTFSFTQHSKINSEFYDRNQIFDKNVRLTNCNLQVHSLEYITNLIMLYCNGKPSKINVFKKKNIKKKTIKVFYKCLYRILGFEINILKFFKILKRLEYKIIEFSKLFLKVEIPNFRFDLCIQEDVIADFLRLYDINKIKSKPINTILKIPNKNKKFNFIKKIKLYFSNIGYSEVLNYSFEDSIWNKIFFKDRKLIKILNPFSKDYMFLRNSLWPGLLKNVLYNQNRQKDSLKIFEIGSSFFKNKINNKKIVQIDFFSGLLFGYEQKQDFFMKKKFFNFYSLKFDLEKLLKNFLNFKDSLKFKKEKVLGLDISQSVSVNYKNKRIGYLGMLDPNIQKKFSINFNTFLFEFKLNKLFFKKSKKFYDFNPFFPKIERDISLIVPKFLLSYKILLTIKKFSKKILKAYIFDVYKGSNISKNKKSISIRIIFQSLKKTLYDQDINKILNKCLKLLYKKYNAKIRKN